MEPTDRESRLKEEIDRNPGISTTDLQNRVQDYMAKDTASKILGDLVGDGKIIQRREGKKNTILSTGCGRGQAEQEPCSRAGCLCQGSLCHER